LTPNTDAHPLPDLLPARTGRRRKLANADAPSPVLTGRG
jgi:hypothetical protein